MVFSLRDVLKKHKNSKILTIDKLDIKEGEVCCITGPNGAGKTTLLEILAGIQNLSSGTLSYDDKKSPQRGFKEIVMVLQGSLVFNTSVYDNISFGLKANKIDKNIHKEKIDNALMLVNLEKFKNRRAVTLSGGEKQRLAIARALALEPKVLILDEPTAGLDINSRDKIIEIIKKIHSHSNIAIIIASHDFDFVLSVSTRIYSLYEGKHVPLSIENVFPGTVVHNTTVKIGEIELCITSHDDGDVNVVIPPENIVLLKKPLSSSMRNRFKGNIVKLEQNLNKVKIWVDIGIVICSTITYGSFQKMKFHLGESIWIEFKATAIKCY